MTPQTLAYLHAQAFQHERPWSEAEFTDLLSAPYMTLHPHSHGFALSRSVAGETELLTLAVDPAHQRRGIARHLVDEWLAKGALQARTAFLEVAADNIPAIALYAKAGFAEIARRPAYYHRKNGEKVDALILQKTLIQAFAAESASGADKSG